MQFVLIEKHLFWWPVTVSLPDPECPGAVMEQSFEALFLALPRDEAIEMDAAYAALKTREEREAHEYDLLRRVVRDWKDVVDENNAVVAYSEAMLDKALQFAWVRTGFYRAYAQAMSGEAAKAKN